MYLTVSVGFLQNRLLPQILGARVDKFSLIKVTEMPACLHTSIKALVHLSQPVEVNQRVLMSHQAELKNQSRALKGLGFYSK